MSKKRARCMQCGKFVKTDNVGAYACCEQLVVPITEDNAVKALRTHLNNLFPKE